MSLSRWKVLACTLTVGVGGLAVFATPPIADKKEAPKEPAPLPSLTVKPATPPNGDDTPAPVKQAKAEEFDIAFPIVPTVTKSETPATKPASEPTFEPIGPPSAPLILPVKGEESKDLTTPDIKLPTVVVPPASKPDATKLPEVQAPANVVGLQVPAIPSPDLSVPIRASGRDVPPPSVPEKHNPQPIPETSPKPATVPPPLVDLNVLPPISPPSKPQPPVAAPNPGAVPPTPSVKPGFDVKPPVAKIADPPMSPSPKPPTVAIPNVTHLPATTIVPTKPSESIKLKMLLRVGDGVPRFEIRNVATSELLLKVYGEKIEMQAPPEARSSLVGVTAMGRVRFTAPGIEGACDHLTILSGSGEVLMKGNIRLKTRHGRSWSEMTAEKLVYQIGASGLAKPSVARPPVTPASYIPD